MRIIEKIENNKKALQFWRQVNIRALIPYLAFGILFIAFIIILGEEIDHHLNIIERWISNLGLLGVLFYVLLFVFLTSMFFPDTVMGIVAGTLFGLKLGVLAVFAGFLVGSAVQFWLSHHLLKDRIEKKIASRPNLSAIQRAVRGQEMRLQLLLRLTPISPAMLSYLLGVSGVRFLSFIIACIVHFPVFFLEVYFGYAGKHIARMAGRSEVTVVMHDILVIGGLITAILAVLIISRMARQAIEESTLKEII
jgi:uncharacterized membrane protein YdjX (TVP38/TMEM64 family)